MVLSINIPNEIKHFKSFCFGSNGTDFITDGKKIIFTSKQPVTVENTEKLSIISANQGGWKLMDYYSLISFTEKFSELENYIYNGVGFICPPELIIMDIDGHDKDSISKIKQDFIDKYAQMTYCEKSISGKGYHLIFRCGSPITMGKLISNFSVGLEGIEIFGGVDCKTHCILTGNKLNESPNIISELPIELRKDIQESALKQRQKNEKTADKNNNILNLSKEILQKINKNPVELIVNLFEGEIESETAKETRARTDFFEQKYKMNAHHFGITSDGVWCLYGNNNRGGSLFEAIAVSYDLYDFNMGNIPKKNISKVIEKINEKYGFEIGGIDEEFKDRISKVFSSEPKKSKKKNSRTSFYEEIESKLPELCRLYTQSVWLKTDAYKEYSLNNVFFLTSLFTLGRATYSSTFGYGSKRKRVSFRSFILGQSSVSRKSTAIEHCLGCLTDVEKEWKSMQFEGYNPNTKEITISDHGYYAPMPQIFTEARLLQDFSENANRYLIFDECASMLKEFRREYNASIRDEFCKFADGSDLHKALKKTSKKDEPSDYSVVDPCFNALVATTPDAFQENVTPQDATSGYLYRFFICSPQYNRVIRSTKEISKNKVQSDVIMRDVVKRFAKMYYYFYNLSEPKHYEFTDECFDYFDAWSEKYKDVNFEESVLSIQARFDAYIYPLSVIIHCLREKYENSRITLDDMKLASEIIDNLYRPGSETMLSYLHNTSLEKLRNICKTYCYGKLVPHSEILRKSKLRADEFKKCMETLIECEEVYDERVIVERSRGNREIVLYEWHGD